MMPMMILFRSIILDSLARVRPAVLVLSFVFCFFAVCPLVLFVCLCSLSVFSLSIIIMLTARSVVGGLVILAFLCGFSFVGKSNLKKSFSKCDENAVKFLSKIVEVVEK